MPTKELELQQELFVYSHKRATAPRAVAIMMPKTLMVVIDAALVELVAAALAVLVLPGMDETPVTGMPSAAHALVRSDKVKREENQKEIFRST